MPVFLRLNETGIMPLGETTRLGWPESDKYTIPEDYLNNGKFIIMRMCNGLGDWGIISAMPRLLKTKYPSCKVYVPSSKLLMKIFGNSESWAHWPTPHLHTEIVFKNNPYVDEFIDEITDEVYHDHYRIYDDQNINKPLLQQMLEFWNFDVTELMDIEPELYFTNDEINQGDRLIKNHIGERTFAGFMCTTSQLADGQFYDDIRNTKLNTTLKTYDYPFVYYGNVPIHKTPFKDNCDIALDMSNLNLPLRIQLYIRSRAVVNIGYQSSIYEMICRYSTIICTEMNGGARENYFNKIIYIQ